MEREGVGLKLDVQGQGGGRISEVDGPGEVDVLKIGKFSRTSYVYHPYQGCKQECTGWVHSRVRKYFLQ